MTDQLRSGIVASRYEILAPLGLGGVATVYKALDRNTGRIVSLKTVRDRPSDLVTHPTEFLHEAAILEKLQHRNILRVYDWGRSDGLLYLALEYVDAESLADVLGRQRTLATDVALGIAREVALALEHAHERKVTHCDIKPGNVLICRDGRVVISDFGFALGPGEPTLNAAGRVVGTPKYMAPEQAQGQSTDARTDIFSMGVVLYEVLAGVAAFRGNSSADVIRHVVEGEPESLRRLRPDTPRPLEQVVLKALKKDPNDRFQSAREFVNALDATGLAVGFVDKLIELVAPTSNASGRDPILDGASANRSDSDQGLSEYSRSMPVGRSTDDSTESALPYVRSFEATWNELLAAAQQRDKEGFVRLADSIVHGTLREAIGYRIEHPIPYFRGTVGCMVDAPMLWIRHSRFPILFVAFDPVSKGVLPVVVKQLEIARATEFFAVLVVVPTSVDGSGNEAEELRRQVSDSVFQHDFVVLDGRHLAIIIEEGSTQRLVEVILRQGVGLHSLSPYVVSGPVPERMFFGREQEVKVISQNLVDRDYAVLGGRRIGKSSILLRLDRLLNSDPRFRAIYINCEDQADRREFLEALSRDLAIEMDTSDSRSFRDSVTSLAKGDDSKRLVFILDEIDELLASEAESRDGPRLFKTFRALSHRGTCRFVFSGSRTLHSHLRDAESPFFNFCEALILRPLDSKSIAEIVTKPMRQLGIDVLDEERFIQLLIEFTSAHPNIAQWLCDRVVKRALETLGAGVPAVLDRLAEALRSNRRTTLNDLEALAATREFQDTDVSTAWGDASPLEKLISLVVSEQSFTVRGVHDALKQYDISDIRLIVDGLNTLELYSLIEKDGQAYRFRLTEFPRLVRQFDGFEWQLESALSAFRKKHAWS